MAMSPNDSLKPKDQKDPDHLTVGCGVDVSRNLLSYDRSAKELASCKNEDFSFAIVSSGEDGKEVGVFEIRKDGKVLRRNISKKFAAGALTMKNSPYKKLSSFFFGPEDVNEFNCNVMLNNHKDVDILDIFRKKKKVDN